MDREIVKMNSSSKKGTFIKRISGMNIYLECMKWLKYIPEFQKNKIDKLNKKVVSDLTLEELDEIVSYKEQERMLELFKIYDTDKISEDEYMEVYDYMMDDMMVEKLMLNKLTKEELEYAKEQIKNLKTLDKKVLRNKIKDEVKEENYNNLSMVDSYILHIISKIDLRRSINELNNKIQEKINENEIMRQKSIEYARKKFLY